MRSDRAYPVAIVGGGFSGTILAAQLSRRGVASLLIDGSGRTGVGTAYSTTEPAHLLNVRAEGMSAWADEPDHFARRFESHGGNPRGFAQRRLFGDYLRGILAAADKVETLDAFAVGAARADGRWSVELADGRTIAADALVLAHGNQLPEPLGGAGGARLINDPWGGEAQAALRELAATGGDALLVGTGLTMVDLVLSLDSAGHAGRIVALSRRGLVPRAHADFTPAPAEAEDVPHGDLIALLRWLRRRAAAAGWRAAIDSLRPHSHALWQSLDDGQQRRFLRHARPWWDVHRHRIAPEVAGVLARLVAEGRLEVIAGRIVSMRPAGDELDVELRRRGRPTSERARFAYGFNCTGPLGSIQHSRDPLLRSVLAGAAARPDGLGIGLEVDERSRVAGGERLWALGPLTKGRYWEIIAVPDIRVQAATVAEDIAGELSA